MSATLDDSIVFHPCAHCGRDLWLVLECHIPTERLGEVHGHELPDELGWFALKDNSGWSACPICGWAIADVAVSPN